MSLLVAFWFGGFVSALICMGVGSAVQIRNGGELPGPIHQAIALAIVWPFTFAVAAVRVLRGPW